MRIYAVILGNMLEFYDFALFAALLPIIATILFPAQTTLGSFTYSYLFLALGFWVRPLGAILFGYIGDHYSPSRALMIAVLIMTISTIGVGVLPTYESIGFSATVMLCICRIMQGLSSGGEYSGASLILTENNSKNRFLNGAILIASGLGGGCLATLAAALISTGRFSQYAWRYLFIIGGCLGLLALWAQLSATSKNSRLKVNAYLPWSSLFTKYKLPLFCTFCFSNMSTHLFMITSFVNTYFVAVAKFNKTSLLIINAALTILCACSLIYFGSLTKKYDPQKMMFYGALGIALFTLPFFFAINQGSLILLITNEVIMVLLISLFFAPSAAITTRLFPSAIRYRGVALGNCLGLAISGTCPYLCAKFIEYTGVSWSPAIYLIIIALFGLLAVHVTTKKLRRSNIENEIIPHAI